MRIRFRGAPCLIRWEWATPMVSGCPKTGDGCDDPTLASGSDHTIQEVNRETVGRCRGGVEASFSDDRPRGAVPGSHPVTVVRLEEETRAAGTKTVPTNPGAVLPPSSNSAHVRRPATRTLLLLNPGADSVPDETPQHRPPLSVPVGKNPEPLAPRNCSYTLYVHL